VTDSETEAYILEDSYIKRYSPRFNIRLKDDKRYPYIAINTVDDFPRLTIQRRILSDKIKYFGPFIANRAAHKIIEVLNDIFKFRRCKNLTRQERGCLYYDIKKCAGVCINKITKEKYLQNINQALKILSGKSEDLIKFIEEEMRAAAEKQRFEEAAEYRDKLFALKELFNYQKIDSADTENFDVIAYSILDDSGCCQKFIYRLGKMVGNEQYFFNYNQETFDYTELISRIIFKTYNNSMFIPQEIILQEPPENIESLENWLTAKRGSKTIITIPQKGKKYEFIEFVKKNTYEILTYNKIKIKITANKLTDLQTSLYLQKYPKIIQGFDISNYSGDHSVGAAVCFFNGLPSKNEYRKYKIKNVEGIDDYQMMRELLLRHFTNALENKNSVRVPDLVLIDGGRQHLNAAIDIIRNHLKISDDILEIISIAKKEELIFKENCSEPIELPKNSQALRLLQYIRDEAHRFGLAYHQTLHSQTMTLSILDSIKGIGEKRKILLLNYFKSLKNIQFATIEQLCKIPGINKKLAGQILDGIKSIDNFN